MDNLWKAMSKLYPQWVNSYGPCDHGEWRIFLHDITREQLLAGIERCRVSDDEWPPTLPCFRQRCLPVPVVPYHRPFGKALPSPPRDLALGERTLANLRTLLRMKAAEKPELDDEAQAERRAIQAE